MFNITITPKGDLKLTATAEGREFIKNEQAANRNYWGIMAEIFEDWSCNGSYTHFDAGQGDPFVGLTSAPCIAESLSIDDNDKRIVEGRLWVFREYMTRDDLEELAREGSVTYQLVSLFCDTKDKE